MAANGRVITGFSDPWVAVYANSGTTVTYSSAQVLARGVSVDITPDDVSDDNIFYADNAPAEMDPGVFRGGDFTLTVDGMLDAARDLVLGLPEATAVTSTLGTASFTAYGDNQAIPYVGFGFVMRYMSDGVTTYAALVLPKCKATNLSVSAATQEEDIDWQTQEITGRILRSDNANHDWQLVGEGRTTAAEALNDVKIALGASA